MAAVGFREISESLVAIETACLAGNVLLIRCCREHVKFGEVIQWEEEVPVCLE